MAEIIGVSIAMALAGALFGWILRRFATLSLTASNAVGIAAAVVLGSYIYTLSWPGVPYVNALIVYGIGGLNALLILLLAAGKKTPKPG